jgi:hypothetical protein
MAKKRMAVFLFIICMGLIVSSCVSQPKFSNYVGLDKSEAYYRLNNLKTSNTLKIALNWLVWGWIGLYIPSVVDSVRYLSYMGEYDIIEHRIDATPEGSKVGQSAPKPAKAM